MSAGLLIAEPSKTHRPAPTNAAPKLPAWLLPYCEALGTRGVRCHIQVNKTPYGGEVGTVFFRGGSLPSRNRFGVSFVRVG